MRFLFFTSLFVFFLVEETATAQIVSDSTDVQTYFVDSAYVYAALDEVTVSVERPIVKMADGKLTYDMSRLNEGRIVGNAYESMLQLPGVQEEDGAITLAGAHSLTVVLNGKPTTMTSEQLVALLKSTPASKIEKAEVMYSAPPHLHVRGGAINLVLKGYREGDGGLQGEITEAYTQQFYANGNGGLSLLYTSPKWNFDFLYNIGYSKEHSETNIHSLHTLDGTVYDIYQNNWGHSSEVKHHVRFGADYTMSESNKWSFAYTGTFSPNARQTENATGNFSNSQNRLTDDSEMHNVSLDYTSGFGLNAGMNYTFYRTHSQQHFADEGEDGDTRFLTHERQQINRWKIYADQSHDLASDWTLNYGAMFTYAGNKNMQRYEMEEDSAGGMDVSDSYSNNREYTFNIYAGFSKDLGEKVSLTASLATEYYKLQDYKKWAVYPSAELNWKVAPGHILQLSFSTDKTYPDYWSLQDYVAYMNKYMEVHGNSLLRPSTDYCTTLTYILKGKYIFNLSYDYEPHHFQQLAYQSSERLALIYKTLNWDSKKKVSFTAVAPFQPFSWWNSRLTAQVSYNRARCDEFFDAPFDHKRWVALAQSKNYFTLSKKPSLVWEVSGLFRTPGAIQGSYTVKGMWMVETGLKWTSSSQKAEIRLKGTDLFNGMRPDLKIRNSLQHLDMDVDQDYRSVSLSFSYKFGGYKEKQRKEVDTSRFK